MRRSCDWLGVSGEAERVTGLFSKPTRPLAVLGLHVQCTHMCAHNCGTVVVHKKYYDRKSCRRLELSSSNNLMVAFNAQESTGL